MALPPQTILACTDYSPASEAAVRRAAALALRHQAKLLLLHVLAVSAIKDAADLIADRYFAKEAPRFDPQGAERAEQARLEAAAAAISAECRIAITPLLRTGAPAAEIAAAAQQAAVDLIIIGGHGSHRVRSRLLGTTTHRLLRQGDHPLLVVKREPPFDYARVLLPTDLSPASLRAAQAALALTPDAQFHVAHAFELPYEGLMNYANADPAMLLQHEAIEHQRLAPAVEQFARDAALPPAQTVPHLARGEAAQRIAEWSEELPADLIVIAARGKSEVERLFIGSVALNVVQAADCDVLLIRTDAPAPA